ncbi:colicin V production protein CvpA [Candidatus Termititenax persephonae]|uniref:Colicin V production protein CvpA n=1 Tax=Candidatus Termititenax persephonae TaxID=2218525 RepID=A0A388TGU8_9BACT|nr:colicin V production protein CvpA [Candidatus Termititenax persephonae]
MSFNWVDALIAIILVSNGLYGLRHGWALALFSIVGWVSAFFLCIKAAPAVMELFVNLKMPGQLAYVLSVALLFVVVLLLVNEIGRHLQLMLDGQEGGWFLDKLGGLAFGLLRGVLLVVFLFSLILSNVFFSPTLFKAFEESVLLRYGHPLIYCVEPLVQDLLRQVGRTWQEYKR